MRRAFSLSSCQIQYVCGGGVPIARGGWFGVARAKCVKIKTCQSALLKKKNETTNPHTSVDLRACILVYLGRLWRGLTQSPRTDGVVECAKPSDNDGSPTEEEECD